MPRLHCIVRGRVQGVGFRYFAELAARKHAVRGWVRNLWGGDVESEVEGSPEALQGYLGELQAGPPFGHVTHVETEWLDGDGVYSDFEIRPTGY